MNIYRIKPHTGDDFCYVDSNTGINLDFMSNLRKGKEMSFKGETPILKLKNKTKKLPDILGTSSTLVFFNDKVKEILEQNVTELKIKFLPVKVDKHDYWLLNIIGYVNCYDYENSEYTTFKDGYPHKISDVKFIKENILESTLFRVEESPVNLFITEKVKNIFEEVGVTGVKYSDNMDLTVGF